MLNRQIYTQSPVQSWVSSLQARTSPTDRDLLREMYLHLFHNEAGYRFLVLRHPTTLQHQAAAQNFLAGIVPFAWKSAHIHGFAQAPSSRAGQPVACRQIPTQRFREFERQIARIFPELAAEQLAWASYKTLLEVSQQLLCPRFLELMASQQTHYFLQVHGELAVCHLEWLAFHS